MFDKLRDSELLKIQQVNDLLEKFNLRQQEERKRMMIIMWVIVGIIVLGAGIFAAYKFLAPDDFEEFDEDFDEFDEDFDDLNYDDDINIDLDEEDVIIEEDLVDEAEESLEEDGYNKEY